MITSGKLVLSSLVAFASLVGCAFADLDPVDCVNPLSGTNGARIFPAATPSRPCSAFWHDHVGGADCWAGVAFLPDEAHGLRRDSRHASARVWIRNYGDFLITRRRIVIFNPPGSMASHSPRRGSLTHPSRLAARWNLKWDRSRTERGALRRPTRRPMIFRKKTAASP